MNESEAQLLSELEARRERLERLVAESPSERLVSLLRQVDAVLAHAEQGEWGAGQAVGSASTREVESTPVCLDNLSGEEQRALGRDLAQAAGVQRALLPPRGLVAAGWETAWHWEPKGAVSGDYIDLLPPCAADEPLHVLLGDVAGKGVAASLLQSHLHALFRALIAPCPPVAELVARANRQFFGATTRASYATLVALRLEADGRVEIANAGHPRPLLADRRGVRPIEGSSLPLGLFEQASFTSHSLQLQPGDTLLLYSDGWTEAARGEDELGIGRAAAVLRRARDLPLTELLLFCRSELGAFLEGTPLVDDLTFLAVRRVAGLGV